MNLSARRVCICRWAPISTYTNIQVAWIAKTHYKVTGKSEPQPNELLTLVINICCASKVCLVHELIADEQHLISCWVSYEATRRDGSNAVKLQLSVKLSVCARILHRVQIIPSNYCHVPKRKRSAHIQINVMNIINYLLSLLVIIFPIITGTACITCARICQRMQSVSSFQDSFIIDPFLAGIGHFFICIARRRMNRTKL